MRMTEIDFEGQPPIDSYAPGGFRVAGTWHEGSLILLPDGLRTFPGTLDRSALTPVLAAAAELDVVLIGQGVEIAQLPGAMRTVLEQAGLGVEVMSTPSACRTYNVLLTEDRRVAALLLAI